ncbi:HD domain-containing protein [Caldanaerovirga acetigignens]|uniref:HD domain-containing protein n=1 Tax=Caldanaerovirga acetigignens TaxID=447595 RepID=A0A1M7MIC2_9FIRM|nr:HD domain-containing protein [Caldanaerovirga acetigignens]
MRENKNRSVSQELIDEMEKYRNVILCSALLHDIGNGPFSHVVERFSSIKHEKWSNRIIMYETTEVHRVLAAYDEGLPRQVRDVITKVFRPQHITKIISSQLDVDRIDYLLRDSLMTGVSYGRFDLEWLLHSLRIGMVENQTEIGFDLRMMNI